MGEFGSSLMGGVGGAASSAIGMGLGLATANWQDKRQVKQAKKLQDLQIKGQKDVGDWNRQQALRMWKDTSYGAQREQMEKAGINVGLMYGGTGAGGTTAGAGAGSVGGQSAAGGSGEIQAGMGLGLDSAMKTAQIDLMKAQAEKLRGVDTKKGETEVLDLLAGIENKKAIRKLTNVQSDLTELQTEILEGGKQFGWDKIMWEADKIAHEATSAMLAAGLEGETYDTKIELVGQELANMIASKALTEAGTAKAGQDIVKSKAEVEALGEKILQGWEGLFIQSGQLSATERANKIRGFEAEIKAAYPGIWNAMGNQLENIWDLGEKLFGEKASYRHRIDK